MAEALGMGLGHGAATGYDPVAIKTTYFRHNSQLLNENKSQTESCGSQEPILWGLPDQGDGPPCCSQVGTPGCWWALLLPQENRHAHLKGVFRMNGILHLKSLAQ